MPSELRHIVFRGPEVVQAVREYHRRLGQSLPTGAVVSCGPETDGVSGPVRFRITLGPDPEGNCLVPQPNGMGHQDIMIEGPALAAALILHCRDRRIPLPANAHKSLQCFGEQLCLVATFNPKQDHLPLASELQL